MQNVLRSKILRQYKTHGRHMLPWRNTRDPYAILVSEIMLQQTQVDRVIPKYISFLKKFPNVRRLARASLASVLREWQGLGYNRRGKMLHDAARTIVLKFHGRIPVTRKELESLSGIGHYTAGAILVFAFDEPDDFVETNIRTVLIHEFFPKRAQVSDAELIALLPDIRGRTSPRLFYSACMDYGAHLKRTGVQVNHKSAQYAKQKPFKGSDREVRGAILRVLSSSRSLAGVSFSKLRVAKALTALCREGLVVKKGRSYTLPK